MTVTMLIGDVRAQLAALPAESADPSEIDDPTEIMDTEQYLEHIKQEE